MAPAPNIYPHPRSDLLAAIQAAADLSENDHAPEAFQVGADILTVDHLICLIDAGRFVLRADH